MSGEHSGLVTEGRKEMSGCDHTSQVWLVFVFFFILYIYVHVKRPQAYPLSGAQPP